jgi:hypothetical protein
MGRPASFEVSMDVSSGAIQMQFHLVEIPINAGPSGKTAARR